MEKFRKLFLSFLLCSFVLSLTGCSDYSGYADVSPEKILEEKLVIEEVVAEPTVSRSTVEVTEEGVVEPIGDVDYYTNVEGDTIQSPTYYPSEPAGATAFCRDGSYSFSANRRGTCSHHGGVDSWL